MCCIALLPAIWDHGERKRAFKSAIGFKARFDAGAKWILINWRLPILAIAVTTMQGIESSDTDGVIKTLVLQNKDQSNRLAQAEAKLRDKTVEERLIGLFNRIDPRIVKQVDAGERTILLKLRQHDFGILAEIKRDDRDAAFTLEPSRNTRTDNEGSIIEVKVILNKGLAK